MLPNTLSGLAGFFIFVVVILGMTAPDMFPDEAGNIVETQTNIVTVATHITNASTQEQSDLASALGLGGLEGIYHFVTNYLFLLGSFAILMFQYLGMFIGIAVIVPTEFHVFFGILSISTVIAIMKLIFLSGD